MMLILRDDLVLETFKSPDQPPDWIEWIDIENEEYQFCDDSGQRYRGRVTSDLSWWRIEPIATPDRQLALALIDRDVDIERSAFPNLASVRAQATSRSA